MTGNQPSNREVQTIATLGLVFITGGAVGGLVEGVVLNGDSGAALISIASIGIGALATLAGAAVLKASGRTGTVDSEGREGNTNG